jgi:DNA polymerase III epsilon subunit-like protein
MKISPSTTFLAFDFETTGLDVKKDEPIQIGIVRADSQFRILDTYTSLIKPQKDIKELKNIVKWIT